MSDRCIMCNEIIPEGRQVCPNCNILVINDKTRGILVRNDEGDFVEAFGGRLTMRALEKLAKIEEKRARGCLLELPCPIDDPIYRIITKIPKRGFPEFSFIKKTRLTFYNLASALQGIGKTFFLTEQEAQNALSKLKNKP